MSKQTKAYSLKTADGRVFRRKTKIGLALTCRQKHSGAGGLWLEKMIDE